MNLYLLDERPASLDLFWIKDQSLADLDNLPAPDVLAQGIIENLQKRAHKSLCKRQEVTV